MLNRRFAMLGWLTWQVGKRFARRKARAAVPSLDAGRPNKGLIVLVLAAAAAVLFFWHRSPDDDTIPGE
jgi:hypothetical protein